MRVSFETYTLVIKGHDKERNLPIMKREDIRRVEGEVIGTVVLNCYDDLGSVHTEPCFIVALDDLSFTSVPIKDCKKVEDIYLDD